MKKYIVMVNWEKKDVKSTPSKRIQDKLSKEGYEDFGCYNGFNVTNISKFDEYENRPIRTITEHSV